MKRVVCDIETFSEADLRKTGAARYAEHPSARILMVSWGIEGERDLHTWDESQDETNRERFLSILTDAAYMVSAWNARFEWTLFKHVWDVELPFSRLHCDMTAALSLGLPASLKQCGEALGFTAEDLKLDTGTRLITKFSKPRRPSKNKPHTRCTHQTDPADWAAYVHYNRQDVGAEARIYGRIKRWAQC